MLALAVAFEGRSTCFRVILLLAGVLGFLVVGGAMGRCGKTMKRTGGVNVLGFELIGSRDRARPLVERWRSVEGGAGWRAARWSVVLDLPFIAAYLAALVAVAASVASTFATRGWTGWHGAAVAAYAVAVSIAVLDLIEDLGLWLVLADEDNAVWPRLATIPSLAKWALTLTALPVLFVTLLVAAWR